jgi:hypothetical protein
MAKRPKMMDFFVRGLPAVLAFCAEPDFNKRSRAFLNEFLYNWGETHFCAFNHHL